MMHPSEKKEASRSGSGDSVFPFRQSDIELAYQIQFTFLHGSPPSIPNIALSGVSLPAQVMGGDYFDFLLTPRGTVRMCVGDVMGKGLAASMLMIMARTAVRSLSDVADSPQALLTQANRILYPDFHRLGSFLTLCFIEYHPATRALVCANAGHLRPLIHRSTREVVEVEVNGMMMGVLPEYAYEAATLTLDPGDTVVLYSDGVIEATKPDHQPVGKRGFYDILRQLPPELPLPVLQERVLQALRQHTGTQPQRDDMTLAFLRAGTPTDLHV